MKKAKKSPRPPLHREFDGKCYEMNEVVPNKKAVATVRGWYASQGAEIKDVHVPDMGGYVIYARMKDAPPGKCAR